jgi:hypothetical protein
MSPSSLVTPCVADAGIAASRALALKIVAVTNWRIAFSFRQLEERRYMHKNAYATRTLGSMKSDRMEIARELADLPSNDDEHLIGFRTPLKREASELTHPSLA